MPSSEVVSDTSPLLNLALVDRLGVLSEQFESITVPDAVRTELLAGEDGADRLETLLESDFVSVQPAGKYETNSTYHLDCCKLINIIIGI
ncbi:hypothetical protein [Halomontanus rarus]|uniref:hypothetical protein n=1 Tax=Halomontanus rarus TaxID=3034020 RepID=UPI001A9927C5